MRLDSVEIKDGRIYTFEYRNLSDRAVFICMAVDTAFGSTFSMEVDAGESKLSLPKKNPSAWPGEKAIMMHENAGWGRGGLWLNKRAVHAHYMVFGLCRELER